MSSVQLPSIRSRPTGSKTALLPTGEKVRSIMSFNAEWNGKGPTMRRMTEDVDNIYKIRIHSDIHGKSERDIPAMSERNSE